MHLAPFSRLSFHRIPLFYGCNHKQISQFFTRQICLKGRRRERWNEIIRSGWRTAYGSIHKASSIMMGSKDTVSESMTDFLYDFITLFPPLLPLCAHNSNDRTGKNLILKSKFNVDDDDPFHPRRAR